MAGTQVFTSESVSEGHPDKMADQISDAILDALLAKDKHARVDREDKELGAGDQGLMFGYATNETAELMPASIMFAHKLVKKQSEARKSGELNWLRPDAKSQVSLRYENHKPVAVDCVVLST